MITDAVIDAFLALVTSLLTLLPSFTLPTAFTSDDYYIGQYVVAFNRIIPIVFFWQCLMATLTLQVALWAYDGIIWIWHQIHGSD